MHHNTRRLSPSLVVAIMALLAAAALAIPMAGQADAATTTVEIVQKAKPNAANLEFVALSPNKSTFFVGAKSRWSDGPFPSQKWTKTDWGQFSTYESVTLPGMCLEVRANVSGAPLMVGPCSSAFNRQRWTQGFSGDPFAKLENLESGRVATMEPSAPTNITGNVVQRSDQGLLTQKWSVRPV